MFYIVWRIVHLSLYQTLLYYATDRKCYCYKNNRWFLLSFLLKCFELLFYFSVIYENLLHFMIIIVIMSYTWILKGFYKFDLRNLTITAPKTQESLFGVKLTKSLSRGLLLSSNCEGKFNWIQTCFCK